MLLKYPLDLPSCCGCGADLTLQHGMDCKKVIQRLEAVWETWHKSVATGDKRTNSERQILLQLMLD